MPSARLRLLTTGSPSVEWFVQSGQAAAEAIRDVLDTSGTPVEQHDPILDFGCGCGRVTRHWTDLSSDVHGCDYNPALVEWCQTGLPFGHFDTNQLEPPLPYPTAHFTLVYALSVFTHLPAPLHRPWIAEIARVCQPGASLLISTHGEAYVNTLTESERHRFHTGQLVVRHEVEAGTNRCGAYCSEQYLQQQFAPEFEILRFVPRGARGNPHQDLTLLTAVSYR